MRRYYTVERIKETLHRAEAAGINTFFGRVDNHVMRTLEEYWDEGGSIQWFGQTASEREDFLKNIRTAAACGAKGCYLHGGQTDHFHYHGRTDHLAAALAAMREEGLAAGFAAHRTEPHEWIRDHLDPDFQLCCYYDPSPRLDDPNHKPSEAEKFDPAHRDAMAATIATLNASAVHYKVLAAGRTPPREAFEYVARVIRPRDVVLVGMFLGDDPDMIETNVRLFERIVQPAVTAI
ncbi:MAG TPA: hypothetical protein VM389_05105, partial [Phycisphaerae bacterium]|nr:hypothetical protein [Phycisphaerae bacterium]